MASFSFERKSEGVDPQPSDELKELGRNFHRNYSQNISEKPSTPKRSPDLSIIPAKLMRNRFLFADRCGFRAPDGTLSLALNIVNSGRVECKFSPSVDGLNHAEVYCGKLS